jgi:H/ACA ribonucleoprotein complex non-core subunit NAF1
VWKYGPDWLELGLGLALGLGLGLGLLIFYFLAMDEDTLVGPEVLSTISSDWTLSTSEDEDELHASGSEKVDMDHHHNNDSEDEAVSIPRTRNELIVPKILESKGVIDLDTDSNLLLKDLLKPFPWIAVPKEENIVSIGTMHGISDEKFFLVLHDKSNTGPKMISLGSLLATCSDRSVLGYVFDVFGPIHQPIYVVLKTKETISMDLQIGDKIGYVSGYTKLIDKQDLYFKGSDASNIYDEEPNESELEYSDDEVEQRNKSIKKKRAHKTFSTTLQNKQPSHHDNIIDYTPLQRPGNPLSN